jgi:hypothetical protein
MNAPDSNLLSINTATVRAQWSLPEIVAGCARRGIRGIAPWRDQVAATGLKESAQRIRDAGLGLSGYCRGGMFPALERSGRRAALDDNKRAVDEALTLSAPCLVLVVGGLPKDSAGRPASKDLASAREMVRDGIGELLEYARPAGMRRTAPASTRSRTRMICATSWAPASVSPSMSTTSGGTRNCRAKSSALAGTRGACSRSTSATGWCRRPTYCSIAG